MDCVDGDWSYASTQIASPVLLDDDVDKITWLAAGVTCYTLHDILSRYEIQMNQWRDIISFRPLSSHAYDVAHALFQVAENAKSKIIWAHEQAQHGLLAVTGLQIDEQIISTGWKKELGWKLALVVIMDPGAQTWTSSTFLGHRYPSASLLVSSIIPARNSLCVFG
jgi:hypothetical protein